MDVNGASSLNGSDTTLDLSTGLSDGMDGVGNHADDEVSFIT